jgi:hypothetical protein
MAQAGDQLAFEFAAGMHINGVVNGLVGHGSFRIVGPKKLQFANAAWCQTAGVILRMGQIGIVCLRAIAALELAANRAG